jgi:hypothetical protein
MVGKTISDIIGRCFPKPDKSEAEDFRNTLAVRPGTEPYLMAGITFAAFLFQETLVSIVVGVGFILFVLSADTALYNAKLNGRNRISIFDRDCPVKEIVPFPGCLSSPRSSFQKTSPTGG